MGLVRRIVRSVQAGAVRLRADIGGAPPPWDDYWYEPLGNSSATGMRMTAGTAQRVAAVMACVGIIGRNIGMMPCKIYTDVAGGGKRVVTEHPLYEVLYSQPNAQQTAFEFKQMMQAHVELRGNAYAEIVPGPRGAVDQLIPMHPDRVTVETLTPSGKLRYVYNDPLTGHTRNLMQEEVFHLRNNCDHRAVGQSTVALACDVFGVALAAQDYSARFLKNDARPGGVITGTNFATKQDEKDFIEQWQRSQTGSHRHRTALLPPGLDYKAISVNPTDAQLLDLQKFSRIQICSIFPVPPHLIGETEKTATYASVEQFNIMFAVQCILPRLVMWEQAIQRDLIVDDRYYSKFSLAALLRGDTASRYAAYHTAIGDGWISQDEVRELEDLNPIPGGIGKNYWRPANWAPLGQLGTAASVAPAAAGDVAEESEAGEDEDSDPGQDDSSGPAAKAIAHRGRLQVLAMSAAERCVRKELAGLRKLDCGDRSSIHEFYAAHARFLAEVLKIDPAVAAGYGAANVERIERDAQFALDYIERRGALELAAMAAGEETIQ